MVDKVVDHYGGGSDIIGAIAASLRKAGKDLGKLTTADLGTVDEFHIRGRQATLELAQSLNLNANSRVLDIGSGLGWLCLGGRNRVIECCFGFVEHIVRSGSLSAD